MTDSQASGRDAEFLAAGMNLVNETATAELVTALRAEDVRSIVLKGPPLRRWLYGNDRFPASMDVDLLVPWPRLDAIDRALQKLGWRFLGRDAIGPGRPFRLVWQQPGDGMLLELHRSIAGMGVQGDEAWEILSKRTETTMVQKVEVEVLDVPARALHLALHAAQHGAGLERTTEDLRRALQKLPDSVWSEAAELAALLSAVPAYTTGLALRPEGQIQVERLARDGNASAELVLRAGGAPPGSEGLELMSQLRGLRAKLAFGL